MDYAANAKLSKQQKYTQRIRYVNEMKKPDTWSYYLLGVAVGNAFLARGLMLVTRSMSFTFQSLMHPGKVLPPAAQWSIQYHWWPYIVAVPAVLLLGLRLTGKVRSAPLPHIIVIVLAIEVFIVFMMLTAFVLPFIGFP